MPTLNDISTISSPHLYPVSPTCWSTDMAPAIPRPDAEEPLVLTSNATRILSRLGLERLVENSFTLDEWRITSATGRHIGGADLGKLGYENGGHPTIALSSSELIKALFKAGTEEAPVVGGKRRVSSISGVRMACGVQAKILKSHYIVHVRMWQVRGRRLLRIFFTWRVACSILNA